MKYEIRGMILNDIMMFTLGFDNDDSISMVVPSGSVVRMNPHSVGSFIPVYHINNHVKFHAYVSKKDVVQI